MSLTQKLTVSQKVASTYLIENIIKIHICTIAFFNPRCYRKTCIYGELTWRRHDSHQEPQTTTTVRSHRAVQGSATGLFHAQLKTDATGAGRFRFNKKGLVTQCPAGYLPENTSPKTKRSNYGAGFDLQRCLACPLLPQCPVTPGKKKAYLRYSEKRYRLAKRRALEASAAFIDDYHWRAGVEATFLLHENTTVTYLIQLQILTWAEDGAVRVDIDDFWLPSNNPNSELWFMD